MWGERLENERAYVRDLDESLVRRACAGTIVEIVADDSVRLDGSSQNVDRRKDVFFARIGPGMVSGRHAHPREGPTAREARATLSPRGARACWSVSLVSLFVAAPALADARAEARAHFKAGMAAIAAKNYDEGIVELDAAYAILPHPNVLFNLARAHAEAGHSEKALETYKKYLEGDPPDREDVQKIVAALELRVAQQKAASEPPVVSPPVAPAPTLAPRPETPCPDPAVPPPVPPPLPKLPENIGKARTEDVFEETVVTASRGKQSPLDAPNSTAVITEQDIRLSGITKIPELLRRLAGVDIMEVTGGQTEVSIRGFNQRLSNKVLVLVDGRSVYVDLLGATFWQALSIGVEDIDRIEVVRGPGSALYGADAFNGVINILTKRPGTGKNGVAGGYGTQNAAHGSLWASGRNKGFGWRAAAGYDYLPRWSREVPNGRADVRLGVSDQVESARTVRVDIRGTQNIGKDTNIYLGGGLVQGNLEVLGIGALNDLMLPNLVATDLTGGVQSKYFELRTFWNRFRSDSILNVAYEGQSLLPSRAEQNIVDNEAQLKAGFDLSPTVHNELRAGGSYRFKDVNWTFLDRQRTEHHFGIFFHDELSFGKRVTIVGDMRLDYVPYLARFVPSPRGALLFHPTKRSTIRANVATAFRKPTFLESYLRLPVNLPVAGGTSITEGVRSEDPNFKVGPERILNAELGYRTEDTDKIVFDASAYYNRVSNLMQLSGARPITVGDIAAGARAFDPQAGQFPLLIGGFSNQCQIYNMVGGELSVRTFPLEGLDLYGSYTLNMVNQDESGCTAQDRVAQVITTDARTSVHKLNAGVQIRTKPGVDGSIDFHFVGGQTWAEQVTNAGAQRIEYQQFELPAYTLLNARLGYRFMEDRVEISVAGFNLAGVQHRQHPFGQVVDRRVMGLGTFRF